MAIKPYVLDLSHYEDVSDWGAVKASGILGAIHKATQGGNIVESKYGLREIAARKAGLLWGAYHFIDKSDVATQIKNFFNTIDLRSADPTLICLDWEPNGRSTASIDQAREWIQRAQDISGRQIVLYSGTAFLKEQGAGKDSILSKCPLWAAQYGSKLQLSAGYSQAFLWQYTGDSEGPEPHNCPGVTTQSGKGVDLSTYLGDAEALMAQWTALATGRAVADDPVPTPVMPTPTVSAPPVITPVAPGPVPTLAPPVAVPPPVTEPVPMPSQTEILRGSRTAGTLRGMFHIWWLGALAYFGISNSDGLIDSSVVQSVALRAVQPDTISNIKVTIHGYRDLVKDNLDLVIPAILLLVGCGIALALYRFVQAIREGRYVDRATVAAAAKAEILIGPRAGVILGAGSGR